MPDERLAAPVKDETPWHQKSPYAGVKDDPNELVIENGKIYRGVNETLTAEAVEQIRTGYRCWRCKEPCVDGAFPETCAVCKFPVREKNLEMFRKSFQGEEWVGTTIDFRKELDRLDDELERDNWAEHPTTGIVVPKGVRL